MRVQCRAEFLWIFDRERAHDADYFTNRRIAPTVNIASHNEPFRPNATNQWNIKLKRPVIEAGRKAEGRATASHPFYFGSKAEGFL